MKSRELIFVTGYFGAPIRKEARRIAARKGWPILDLDQAIEEKDGRSIARLCMMGGEHAYRNAEFEQAEALCGGDQPASLVVACGDGILYDDDTRRLILQHQLVIAGTDQPLDELWENARQDETTYHAFMKFGTDEEKRAKFEAHHERQRTLFETVQRDMANENGNCK